MKSLQRGSHHGGKLQSNKVLFNVRCPNDMIRPNIRMCFASDYIGLNEHSICVLENVDVLQSSASTFTSSAKSQQIPGMSLHNARPIVTLESY